MASLPLSLQFPHYLGGAYVHRLSDVQLKLKGAAYKMQTKMFTAIKKKDINVVVLHEIKQALLKKTNTALQDHVIFKSNTGHKTISS